MIAPLRCPSNLRWIALTVCLLIFQSLATAIAVLPASPPQEIDLAIRKRVETSKNSGRFHTLTSQETWSLAQTAVIVCDMWDYHHCLNAVRRVEEFAPRLNQVLKTAREQGATIIHSPSSCMAAYDNHPARLRAMSAPAAADLPEDINSWCHSIPAEEKATYPIDQSDGGEDDDPKEHADWAAKLEEMGRNPRAPWKKQTELLSIDPERDFVSDRGEEVWNILQSKEIDNVILVGVHTNMCVLGRPFGLRQMAKNGKNVVLMRDMTDTMYNPKMSPFVSHFSGTDLIVEHIEKHVCPTITSDQFIGGKPFRFKNDRRPHVAIVMAEDEYETNQSLPAFAAQNLDKNFRVSHVFANDGNRNDLPGLESLSEADVAVFSIRRRVLKPNQMETIRRFVQAGKPVIGIRTASHAFSLREKDLPKGYQGWPEFDARVFGGNYTGHHGNKLKTTVKHVAEQVQHPVLNGVGLNEFVSGGSLYKTSPVASSATILLTGQVADQPAEPVAWTYRNQFGGRAFYTSLGHKSDFENQEFGKLLVNAVDWVLDEER